MSASQQNSDFPSRYDNEVQNIQLDSHGWVFLSCQIPHKSYLPSRINQQSEATQGYEEGEKGHFTNQSNLCDCNEVNEMTPGRHRPSKKHRGLRKWKKK